MLSKHADSETIVQEAAICAKCYKRRSERRDIIGEIFETEVKYGRDLRIVLEEFHRPMLVAGLLTSDQLGGIFLNTDELIQVSDKRENFLTPNLDWILSVICLIWMLFVNSRWDICMSHSGKWVPLRSACHHRFR